MNGTRKEIMASNGAPGKAQSGHWLQMLIEKSHFMQNRFDFSAEASATTTFAVASQLLCCCTFGHSKVMFTSTVRGRVPESVHPAPTHPASLYKRKRPATDPKCPN